MMRKLFLLPLILIGAFLGGNLVAERAAEAALGDAAGKALGLHGSVRVDLKGFPVLLDVMQGRLGGLEASVSDQKFDGLSVDRVTVGMEDLESQGSILGSGPLSIATKGATVSARISQKALNDFLRKRGHDVTVKLLDGEVQVTAKRVVLGSQRKFKAVGPVTIEGQNLVFRPRDVSWDGPNFPGASDLAKRETTISERIPSLPANTALKSVSVNSEWIELLARSGSQSFKVR